MRQYMRLYVEEVVGAAKLQLPRKLLPRGLRGRAQEIALEKVDDKLVLERQNVSDAIGMCPVLLGSYNSIVLMAIGLRCY